MALTGLFLCLFLVGHLLGNLQLLSTGEDARQAFNEYAKFMTTFAPVKILSYLTYFSILFHTVDGIMLYIQNRKARPEKYAYTKPGTNSKWASRNMALLGTLVLFFIVSHMKSFWYEMHWGEIPTQMVEGEALKDLYAVVLAFFKDESMGLVWTSIYVVSMVALAFHLSHGIQSAFQSMGVNHRRYTPIIKAAGMGFAILVPLAFAAIPVFIHFVL